MNLYDQITREKLLNERLRGKIVMLERELGETNQSLHESQKRLQNLCRQNNHRYSDGNSAFRSYFSYSSCKICGYTDL